MYFDSLILQLPSFAILKENKYKDTYVLKQQKKDGIPYFCERDAVYSMDPLPPHHPKMS